MVPNAANTAVLDIPWMNVSGIAVGCGTTPPTISVTNGSTTATTSANHGVTSGLTAILGIAGITYTATAGSTTALTLNWAYQGVTNSSAAITSIGGTASIASENWALKFTGVAIPWTAASAITGRYQNVKFNVTPNTNVNTPINPFTGNAYTWQLGFVASVIATDVQAMFDGTGTPAQVGEEEILAQLQNTGKALQAYPPYPYIQETSQTGTYMVTSLSFTKNLVGTSMPMGSISSTDTSSITVVLAIDSTLTTNDNTVIGTVFTV